jgi:hypothetical protein
MIRKFLMTVAAVATLAGATLATASTAQAGYGYGYGHGHSHGYVKVYRPHYYPSCYKVVKYDYYGNPFWTKVCH